MKSLFLLSIFLMFPLFGVTAPFVAGLGYLWVDLVQPQEISYMILNSLPVSFIMFLCTVILYLLFDRRDAPNINGGLVLLLLFGIWISLTTTWAEVSDKAIWKWDWAVKGVGFGFFIPFIFRSRVQIESLLAIINFSVAALYISYGAVTVLTGGGYGNLTRSNSGVAESSTLSMVCIMLIPVNLYFYKYSIIFKESKFNRILFLSLIAFSVATSVGTFARTGLIAGIVLAALLFLRMKSHRFAYLFFLFVTVSCVFAFAPDAWFDRMNTVSGETDELDSSALGRLAIWAWTLDYVSQNPLGGGFEVYRISSGEYFGMSIHGKAFHSAYFEILGEHGYPGLLIYVLIYFWVLGTLNSVRYSTKKIESLQWLHTLSLNLMMSFIVYAAGSMFVGVAFQPIFYYFVGVTICLKQYHNKAVKKQEIILNRFNPLVN